MTTTCGLSPAPSNTSARRAGVSQSNSRISRTVRRPPASTSRSRPPKRSRKVAKNLAFTVIEPLRPEQAAVEDETEIGVPDIEDEGNGRPDDLDEVLEDLLPDDEKGPRLGLGEDCLQRRPQPASAELERPDLVHDQELPGPKAGHDVPGDLQRRGNEAERPDMFPSRFPGP